jgi:predicted site-specific integrase-resolvase
VKEAAHRSGISARTLQRWALEGVIVADRLASGVGEWRIALNAHNLPISTTPYEQCARSKE